MPGPSPNPGPGRYRLLKEFAKRRLRDGFGVPEECVHEEFPLGDVILDVVAYPPVERSEEAAIAVECGGRSGPPEETRRRFETILRHVDLLVWFPDAAYGDSFADVVGEIDGPFSVAAGAFEVEPRFAAVSNAADGDGMCGLVVSETGRFPWLDERGVRGETASDEGLAG